MLKELRQKRPLVHNITNYVVAQFVANGLLALGASPLMSDAIAEMPDLAKISDALAINIGTSMNAPFYALKRRSNVTRLWISPLC